MNRHGWMLLLLLIVSTAPEYAKSQEAGKVQIPRKVFQANVDLAQLDVTVTDSEGQPVTDLTAEDFIVIQDARPREITSFSLVRTKDAAVAEDLGSASASKDPDTRFISSASGGFRKSQVRRVVALVVDDLAMGFRGIYDAREAIRKWVDEEMQPGDLAALICTGRGVGTLQQFTTDKKMLYAAIENITFNNYNRAEDYNGDHHALDIDPEFKRALLLASLQSIEYVVEGLKNLPGRKSLILFSESLEQRIKDMKGEDIFDSSVENKMLKLVKEANRTAVVIHAIDTRGLFAFHRIPTPADPKFNPNKDPFIMYLSTQDGMVTLSKGTGGLFEHDRNDIDGALIDTVRDGDVYYLLGYEPDEKTAAEMRQGKYRYHSIKVKVKRKGMHVRTRKDFMGNPDPDPEPQTRRERIEQAMYSPFASGSLPVRLTALYGRTRDGLSRLNTLLHFDVDKLNFTEEPEEWRKAEVEITVALFDIYGQQLDRVASRAALEVRGETYEEMRKNGVMVSASIPAGKSGVFQVRVVVSDIGSELAGSAMQYVEVPEIGNGRLALSGITLASSRFRQQEVENGADGMIIDSGLKGTPAVRIFEPGETIGWAYQVLNAKTGEDGMSRLQTVVRLFRDGKEIHASAPAEVVREPEIGSGRLIGIGQMKLRQLAPGGYDLQVTVTDMLAQKRPQTAAQSIRFEVEDATLAGVK